MVCTPEIRRAIGLEKTVRPPVTVSSSQVPKKLQQAPPSATVSNPRISQHALIKVAGHKNVAGNIVTGKGNVVGNNNQTNSTAANSPISVQQTGKNNISQIGNNNNASVTEFDPNSPQVTYEVNGVRHTERPGKTTVDDNEVQSFNQLMVYVNAQDWKGAQGLAEQEIRHAPEWPTPYFVFGQAEANLCNKQEASVKLNAFLTMVQNRQEYARMAEDAKKFVDLMGHGEMPPQCPKQ